MMEDIEMVDCECHQCGSFKAIINGHSPEMRYCPECSLELETVEAHD